MTDDWLEIENEVRTVGFAGAQRIRVRRIRQSAAGGPPSPPPLSGTELRRVAASTPARPAPPPRQSPPSGVGGREGLGSPAGDGRSRFPSVTVRRPSGLVYERLLPPRGSLLRVPRRLVFAPEEEAEPDSGRATVDVLVQLYRVHRPVEVALVARLESLEPDALRVLSRPAALALDLAVPQATLPLDPAPETPSEAQPGMTLVALAVVHDPMQSPASGGPIHTESADEEGSPVGGNAATESESEHSPVGITPG